MGPESYTAEDPEFGKIAGFGELTEAEGTEAPRQTVQLLPTGNAGLAALTSPSVQGSPATIYAAVIDQNTGQAPEATPCRKSAGSLEAPAAWPGIAAQAAKPTRPRAARRSSFMFLFLERAANKGRTLRLSVPTHVQGAAADQSAWIWSMNILTLGERWRRVG